MNIDFAPVFQFLLLKMKLGDFEVDLIRAVAVSPNAHNGRGSPQEHAVKYSVKLFIDLGGKVFPVLCFFPCSRAF